MLIRVEDDRKTKNWKRCRDLEISTCITLRTSYAFMVRLGEWQLAFLFAFQNCEKEGNAEKIRVEEDIDIRVLSSVENAAMDSRHQLDETVAFYNISNNLKKFRVLLKTEFVIMPYHNLR